MSDLENTPAAPKKTPAPAQPEKPAPPPEDVQARIKVIGTCQEAIATLQNAGDRAKVINSLMATFKTR